MNESQLGETKYYGAGKFMKPKKERRNSVRNEARGMRGRGKEEVGKLVDTD